MEPEMRQHQLKCRCVQRKNPTERRQSGGWGAGPVGSGRGVRAGEAGPGSGAEAGGEDADPGRGPLPSLLGAKVILSLVCKNVVM